MTKPSYPAWIPSNNVALIVAPSGAKLSTGWAAAEKPAFQYMNWFFNLVSNWINLVGAASHDVVVGAGANCTHATLAAAVADAAVTTNVKVLIQDSVTLAATVNLTKAGWQIEFAPGVTYTAGAATIGFSLQASGIEVRRARFSGFATAIVCTSGWTYGRALFNNFASCTTEVDDSLAPAGQKPVVLGNITE